MKPQDQTEPDKAGCRLPSTPEPTEVEIELTNICNASCSMCPRGALTEHRGMMSEATFTRVVESYAGVRPGLAINRITGGGDWPLFTFAGLGEPTLHPHLARFAALATSAGFAVVLFTNGSRLDERKSAALIQAGVRTFYVSFWGIEANEYAAAMSLDYHATLRNVETLRRLCEQGSAELVVTWIQAPQVASTPNQVARFWRERGIEVDMSEFSPWNRGGHLSVPELGGVFAGYEPVDTRVQIWCDQLAFTDTVTWEGNVVLCSQDYFKRSHVLGTAGNDPCGLWRAKGRLLAARPIPALCQACRKPSRNYAFGSEPWDRVLDETERARYDYELRDIVSPSRDR
ncbi:MAG: radical SAM/SPASM domain-containing protein [Solidesulfovibrio sp. DCME]|uniref:radical SAM/SPASM domain-containing protein n=1 Tax=Solidesulfovibrio sp. DCME TaxID=3447380 RepID=UPI003D105F29